MNTHVIIHSREEPSRRRIRLVVMHHVTLHAVKQRYQFAVHASLMRVTWCMTVGRAILSGNRVYRTNKNPYRSREDLRKFRVSR